MALAGVPSTHDAGSWMPQTALLGPAGYPAPPSPADNEPERTALINTLRDLLIEARAERAALNAELNEARAEAREARAEATDAKIAELRFQNAEMRMNDKYNALWNEMEDSRWHNGWHQWRGRPQ